MLSCSIWHKISNCGCGCGCKHRINKKRNFRKLTNNAVIKFQIMSPQNIFVHLLEFMTWLFTVHRFIFYFAVWMCLYVRGAIDQFTNQLQIVAICLSSRKPLNQILFFLAVKTQNYVTMFWEVLLFVWWAICC